MASSAGTTESTEPTSAESVRFSTAPEKPPISPMMILWKIMDSQLHTTAVVRLTTRVSRMENLFLSRL